MCKKLEIKMIERNDRKNIRYRIKDEWNIWRNKECTLENNKDQLKKNWSQ